MHDDDLIKFEWLYTQKNGDFLEVWVDATDMATSSYVAHIKITAPGEPDIVTPIALQAVDEVHSTYMPMVHRTP